MRDVRKYLPKSETKDKREGDLLWRWKLKTPQHGHWKEENDHINRQVGRRQYDIHEYTVAALARRLGQPRLLDGAAEEDVGEEGRTPKGNDKSHGPVDGAAKGAMAEDGGVKV